MAIAVRSHSVTLSSTTGSTIEIAKPAGLASGDLMLLLVEADSTAVATITPPTGFVSLGYQSGGSYGAAQLFYKIATVGDAAAASFLVTLSSARRYAACLVAFSGVDQAGPIRDYGSSQMVVGTDIICSPNVSVAAVTDLLVFAIGKNDDRTVSNYRTDANNPASWTEVLDEMSSSHGVAVACGFPSGTGSTSGWRCNLSAAVNTVQAWCLALAAQTGPEWDCSILVNDGAQSTDDNDVVLTLHAEADGAAPDEMCFSIDGVTWTAWEAYAATKLYQLPAQDDEDPHLCTVYAKFKTGSEESPSVSDSITLQVDWSYLSCVIDDGQGSTPTLGVGIALKAVSSADDSTNGEPDFYRIRENGGAWSGWTAFVPNGRRGWMRLDYNLGGYGERIIEVQWMDHDGNTSRVASATITALAPQLAAEVLTAEPAQTILVGVLAYLDGTLVAELRPVGGSVSADGRRSVVRTASIEFAPDSERTHREVYELLTTPGLELVVRRGWVTPYGGEVVLSLGRFIVDEATYVRGEGGTAVAVDCSDLAVRVQRARWTDPYQIASGTALATALEQIILDRWPAAIIGFDAVSVPDTLGAAAVFEAGADSDPWADAQSLAAAHGYVLYPDAEGVFRLRVPPDPNTATPVWAFEHGAGAVILEATRTSPMERVYNGVIVSGEGSGLDVPVRGEAWDEAADSPTSIHGPYGLVPYFYSSPLITTGDQAETVAASMLARVRGRIEQLSWQEIPNPVLQPLDPVSVEDGDGVVHTYIIDELDIPLSAADAMSVTARETRAPY